MRKSFFLRVTAIVLSIAMALPASLYAGQNLSETPSSDVLGHWAEPDFKRWFDSGLIAPDEQGLFYPDTAVDRAEFAGLINRVFRFQAEADGNFKDVPANAPFYGDIMKAVAAGYMKGDGDGGMKPLRPISRQEAAVVLYRVFHLKASENGGEAMLSDVAGLPDWSRDAVASMVRDGYIQGYPDGAFKSGKTITRAEAIRLIGRIAGEIIAQPGTYGELEARNAVINRDDILIENSQFSGNIYLTEGVLEGDIKLDGVAIGGTLYVFGGGSDSVLLHDTETGEIVVNKQNGTVRVVLSGSASAGIIRIYSNARIEGAADTIILDETLPEGAVIELIGDFGQLEVRSPHQPTIRLQGSIGRLTGLAAEVIVEETAPSVPGTAYAPRPTPTPPPSPSPQPSYPPDLTEPPVFRDDSVHDPSIIVADGQYYVFGSHLAAAKSPDLLQWTSFASGVNSANPLFDDVLTDLREAFDWAEIDGLWAADVIQLADGKYYMYYNACRGDAPISALGIATADHIEGPYVNQGIIIKSGKGTAPLGGSYNARVHPNAIDPDVFYDKDGKLWMVYGSYSGGIFIMELDPDTGFPISYENSELNSENSGYGRKLMGGNHARIEAPYIQYVPETGYYYLYVTFGGLDAIGGYNMRVSRAVSPEGPYFDAEGNNMLLAIGLPSLGLVGNDPYIESYGVKQAGNFVFSNLDGVAQYPTYGYVSPGHNSVYYDEDSGKQFNIFHARFPGRAEAHEIRVHQMWMNEDGWPVMAPHRYAGETIRPVELEEITGPYHYINHGKGITSFIEPSSYIELLEGGLLGGSAEGRWELQGDNRVTLHVWETAGEASSAVEYKGVFARLWDPTREAYVMTFSAVSDKGAAIWGSQLASLTYAEIVANVRSGLHIGDTSRVYGDLNLPAVGARGSLIAWSSSDETIVELDGTVNRPAPGAGDASVQLIATITKGGASAQRSFSLIVKEQASDPVEDGLTARYSFEQSLADRLDSEKSGAVVGNRIGNLEDGLIGYGNGVSGQAAVFDGDSGIRLPDGLISSSSYTVSLWIKPDAITNFTTTFFGAASASDWISMLPQHAFWNSSVLWSLSNGGYYDANTAVKLTTGQWTQLAFTVDEGTVKVYVNGVQKYSGTGFPDLFRSGGGTFGLGVNYWDIPFQGLMDELRIYEIAVSGERIAEQYARDLGNVWDVTLNLSEATLLSGGTIGLTATLSPGTAVDKSIVWSSDNEAVATVDEHGVVTAHGAGSAIISAVSHADPTKRAAATIMVTETAVEVESVVLGFTEISLRPGQVFVPAGISVLPIEATNKSLLWSIDDAEVASIESSTGKLTGLSSGQATVTAIAADGSGVEASYTLYVNKDGLVAHFAFENDLNDATGTFGSGSVTGDRLHLPGGTIGYDDGAVGQAAVFDGSSGIRLPNGLISGSAYSVSFWLKPDALTDFTTTFFGEQAEGSWISFVPRGGDFVAYNTFLWSGTAWYDANTGAKIPAGQWTFVTFTVNNGTVHVYLNGELKFTGNGFPHVFNAPTGVFGLGVNYWDAPFAGLIDELKVYNVAITGDEAAYWAAQGQLE